MAQMVKNLPVMQETQVWSLGREDPLEKEMANPLQYSCLENPLDRGAWRATAQRVGHDWMTNTFTLEITWFKPCNLQMNKQVEKSPLLRRWYKKGESDS